MRQANRLTDSPLLIKNTLINLFGYGSPLIVALFSIPKIIDGLGTDRFGVLTIAWVFIGYFGLLDLGLGRALTMVVSERLGARQNSEIPSIIWTALLAMMLVSITISIVVLLCCHWMIYDILKIPHTLRGEAFWAFIVLTLFIPIVVLSIGFRGILEAYQRFDLVNIIRIPHGIFSFAAPLAVIPFSVNLIIIIAVLCFGRIIVSICQFILCRKIIPDLNSKFSIQYEKFCMLMKIGGWMTVTNVVSPMLVYMDRLFIGAILSVSAVAYYATPSEVITKLSLLSGALMSVLFPAISATFQIDRQRSALLLQRGIKYIFLCLFPIIACLVTFAPEGLAFWLNADFLKNSTMVTRILAIGIFFSCLGQVPYAFIQGAGRPDLTAKLHLIEIIPYIVFLIVSIKYAGIVGAAMVWATRYLIDTATMYIISQKLLDNARYLKKSNIFVIILYLTPIIFTAQIPSFEWRFFSYVTIVAFFGFAAIRYFLSGEEKLFLINNMLSFRRRR